MMTHYLAAALRHFRRHKLTTSINVLCLSIGLACFICAWAVARYLTQSDHYHGNAERIYAITEKISIPGVDASYPAVPSAAWIVADYLKVDLPQLQAVARASAAEEVAVAMEGKKGFLRASYVDASFLDIFDLSFVAGDGRRALRNPRTAVISEAAAIRQFGTANVVGRQLLINDRETVQIRGVIAAVRQPSHLSTEVSTASIPFDVLISMDTHVALRSAIFPPEIVRMRYEQIAGWLNYYTYVLLPKDGSLDSAALNAALESFGERHAPKSNLARAEFAAQHVSEIPTLGLNLLIGTDKTGISSTTLLLSLGILVLLVSCLNYANLAAAQANTRTQEIAVRRIIGANRTQVLAQHFAESLVLTAVALIVALTLVGVLMTVSTPMMTTALSLVLLQSPLFWLLVPLLLVWVTAAASIYPGFVLARIRAASALRHGRSRNGPRWGMKILVGAQFVAASFLLILVLVMQQQNEQIRARGLALTDDPVVLIANDVNAVKVNAELLRTELARQPHIRAVTSIMTAPWSMNGNSYGTVASSPEKSAQNSPVVYQYVGHDFFTTLHVRVLAGRVFNKDRADEFNSNNQASRAEGAIVIDHALAQRFGWQPADAVGRILYYPNPSGDGLPPLAARVIGVVEPNQFTLMRFGAAGTVYTLNPAMANLPLVRVSKANVAAGLAEIDAVWNALAPNVAIKRRFLDEQFEQNYAIFNWVTRAFGALASFAFLIAAMGLVGMAIHVASRRTHEIGVRKTLGASVVQILSMLLQDFSKPVLIANLLAWPFAYLAAQAYLSVFANHSDITLLPFAISLAVTLVIAWAAVIFQAGKAARMKPANVLRYE